MVVSVLALSFFASFAFTLVVMDASSMFCPAVRPVMVAQPASPRARIKAGITLCFIMGTSLRESQQEEYRAVAARCHLGFCVVTEKSQGFRANLICADRSICKTT